MVLTTSDASDLVHSSLDLVGDLSQESGVGQLMLHPGIAAFDNTSTAGTSGVQTAVLELEGLFEGIDLLDFVLSHQFNRGNFVGSTETIEEVEDGEAAFKARDDKRRDD